jgi:hypothetical protein
MMVGLTHADDSVAVVKHINNVYFVHRLVVIVAESE